MVLEFVIPGRSGPHLLRGWIEETETDDDKDSSTRGIVVVEEVANVGSEIGSDILGMQEFLQLTVEIVFVV